MNNNKIILFAKQSGLTSFSSLFTIKHALKTERVGHTGTLDSFAQGLLVVCAGSLTKIASKITEFDKTYQAVIKFGEETDTLECTGKITKTTALPLLEDFENSVKKFQGELKQIPPIFSALHIDGNRASDLVRSGKSVEIPERKITVFSSKILETKLTQDKKVIAARVEFSVSKGTYIRSLARDIGNDCKSSATLYGLYRTKVGNFNIEDAAGFSELKEFSIDSAFKTAEILKNYEKQITDFETNLQSAGIPKKEWKYNSDYKELKNRFFPKNEENLKKEIIQKSINFNQKTAKLCGFGILTLNKDSEKSFKNGQKLHSAFFTTSPFEIKENYAAVFSADNNFCGLLQKNEKSYFEYCFVIPENS